MVSAFKAFLCESQILRYTFENHIRYYLAKQWISLQKKVVSKGTRSSEFVH